MNVETTFTGFTDRREGGRRLARALAHYHDRPNTIVVGLPRGGIVTAASVAEDLDLPLDVLVVRKLGTPGQEELAMGAIGPGGMRVFNDDVIGALGISRNQIEDEVRRETAEVARRERLYRGDHAPLDLAGRTVIVVDDGLATGSTMAVAIAVIRQYKPVRVVVAVPVAPMDTLERLRFVADELVYLETPEPFQGVGYWYVDFAQIEDDEVVEILRRASARVGATV